MGFNGIDVNGNKEKPVIITAISFAKPYGTVGVLGDGETISNIKFLQQSYGE